jgi:hypothetical protein
VPVSPPPFPPPHAGMVREGAALWEGQAKYKVSRLRGDAGIETRGAAYGSGLQYMSWDGRLGRMAQSRCRKVWIWHRAPFPLNSRIQALVAHPTKAHTVLAGGDTGLFVSHNGGARWERIGADGAVPTIWSLTIGPG